MSASYAEITKQIAELQALATAARDSEIASAKAKVQAIMQEHRLTLSDISGAKPAHKAREPVAIKYKNSGTGET